MKTIGQVKEPERLQREPAEEAPRRLFADVGDSPPIITTEERNTPRGKWL